MNVKSIFGNISDVLTVTYGELFMQLGYSIVDVGFLNNACKIEFVGINNHHKTETIEIKDISIKTAEHIAKYKQDLTAIYVVGDSLKPKEYFPNNSIYINGHVSGSVIVNNSGIAIIKNDDVKIETEPKFVRPTNVPRLIGDTRKFRELTGWIPKIKFDQLLEDILEYWRDFVKKDLY